MKKQEDVVVTVHSPGLISDYADCVRGTNVLPAGSPTGQKALEMRELHKGDQIFIEYANVIDCLWRLKELDDHCHIYILDGPNGDVVMDKRRALHEVHKIITHEYVKKVKPKYIAIVKKLLDSGETEMALEVFNDNLRDDLGNKCGAISLVRQELGI